MAKLGGFRNKKSCFVKSLNKLILTVLEIQNSVEIFAFRSQTDRLSLYEVSTVCMSFEENKASLESYQVPRQFVWPLQKPVLCSHYTPTRTCKTELGSVPYSRFQ